MISTAILVVARTLLGAAWVVTHVMLTWRVTTNPEVETRSRRLALLPPLTPWVAWKNGHRALVMLWLLWLAAYGLSLAGSRL